MPTANNRDLLDEPARKQALSTLNAGATTPWVIAPDQQQRDQLQRKFRFRDFNQAFGFITRVALAAEAMDHHPDWCNSYRSVQVRLCTHSAGGITALDFALAERIEALAR